MEKLPPSYRKESDEETPAVEAAHTLYDYAQNYYEPESIGIISFCHTIGYNQDFIALIDLNESNLTYGQIINKITLGKGEEIGRMNWARSATSLSDVTSVERTHLIVPCMNSNRIYVVEVFRKTLRIAKVIRSSELLSRDVSTPYSVHTLPINGAPVHISTMGDREGHAKGDFVLLDKKTFDIRTRKKTDTFSGYGGDFCLQTRHNVLISCEWGHPRIFRNGLSVDDLENVSTSFGTSIHIWQIAPGVLKQTIELDPRYAQFTTSVRFLHNADCNHAFVCSALGGSIFHLHMESVTGRWSADHILTFPPYKVTNWISNEIPAMLTDSVISLDDRWLYVAGWLHGYIWRFDISDPFRITLSCKIHVGGILASQPGISFQPEHNHLEIEKSNNEAPGFRGGPGSLQLSLDGRRLYVSNSAYKVWDAQFYPELSSIGGQILRIDIGINEMTINKNFKLDLAKMAGGPYVAREIHFGSGDCTSDSFH
ncbi:unnamed protein product [Auanema sp. JU1783]|nr:unnamed protein product [Auanema sp. JU1783]